MRIALVLEDLNDTGANRVSLDRASRWLAAGEDVIVFVLVDAGRARVPVPPQVTPVFGAPGHRRLRTTLPVGLRSLLRLVGRCDVVVAGTEVGFALLLARFAAAVVGRPFTVLVQSRVDLAVQGYVTPSLRGLTRRALIGADLAVCVARDLVAATVAFGVPTDRVVAVPNAVAKSEVTAAAALEPVVRWDADLPLVVGSGRLTTQKGFDLLIRAHAEVLATGGPAHTLMVLGDGDDRAALAALAAQLGVHDSVLLPGSVANPHAMVSRASLFVLSSRWEGFGLSLAEAIACGTACIAFDCVAGPAEVLDGGRFGRLVPPGDVAGLADAIRAHLADPRDLDARARLAAGSDLDMFAPARAAEKHRQALLGAIDRRTREDGQRRRIVSSARKRAGMRRARR